MSISGTPQAVLTELLQKTIDVGGSDLHIRVDIPPQIRLHGHDHSKMLVDLNSTANAKDLEVEGSTYGKEGN